MLEQVIAEFPVPYRDPLRIHAFSFGIDEQGRALCSEEGIEGFEPAIFLVAGLRGDEVQQTFVCAQMVARLSELEASGALARGRMITVVPCANPTSMGISWRFWPGDKTDINRMFPGYSQGETTQRIADAVFEHAKAYRYGVHFGSFYLQGDFLPHVRVVHGPGESTNNGADFGLPYVLHHVPGSFDTTTLHYNWRLWDTEAYSLYLKETALVDAEAAEEAVRATMRFMDERGIIRWPHHRGYHAAQIGEQSLQPVLTTSGGVFCPLVKLGDVVRAGTELASIVDPLRGVQKEALHAPCDGVVFYEARTPLVNQGTLAFQIVPPDAAGSAESETRGNFLDPEA